MSSLNKAIDGLVAATVEVLWGQWQALGASAAQTNRPARAMVDPEALLLGSFALAHRERRLDRFLRMWPVQGARVLSVQRAKNLVGDYDVAVADALARFAAAAVREGDRRWGSLAAEEATAKPRAKDVGAGLVVSEPAALAIRLRLAFGVGIKADVLAYLSGSHGQHRPMSDIAAATGYYERAVRRAVDELVAARFVRAWASAPASYSIDVERWAPAFGLDEMPLWMPWQPIFAFVAHLDGWHTQVRAEKRSSYMQSSGLRDLIERRRGLFERTRFPLLDHVDDYPGEDLLPRAAEMLDEFRDRVVGWA